MGIIYIWVCLALQEMSKVFSGLGGLEVPNRLYTMAVPSGIGKNRLPSCCFSCISGTCSFSVMVKGL